MLVYLVQRTGALIAGIAVASVAVFAFMAVLPGDPAQVALGVNATPEAVAAKRHEFGLDRPLGVRFVDWVSGLLVGDFGTSYVSHTEIGPQLVERMSVTLSLVVGGMLIAVIIGVPAGIFAAVHRKGVLGVVLSGISQVGMAIPAFLVGILLVYVLAVRAGVLPSGGYTPFTEDPSLWFRGLLMPWLSLGFVQGAVLMRYTRSAVIDVLGEDYLRTARAKGRTGMSALWRHGLRNAALTVFTVLGLQLATLLVGAVVVERVFVVPGLGDLLLQAVADRDLLVVQNIVLLLVVAILSINFVVDAAYAVLDPRLRQAR